MNAPSDPKPGLPRFADEPEHADEHDQRADTVARTSVPDHQSGGGDGPTGAEQGDRADCRVGEAELRAPRAITSEIPPSATTMAPATARSSRTGIIVARGAHAPSGPARMLDEGKSLDTRGVCLKLVAMAGAHHRTGRGNPQPVGPMEVFP